MYTIYLGPRPYIYYIYIYMCVGLVATVCCCMWLEMPRWPKGRHEILNVQAEGNCVRPAERAWGTTGDGRRKGRAKGGGQMEGSKLQGLLRRGFKMGWCSRKGGKLEPKLPILILRRSKRMGRTAN